MAVLLRAAGTVTAWVAIVSCSERAEESPLVRTAGHEVIVDVYTSTDECIAAGRLDHVSCRKAEHEARTKHPRFAHKFAQQMVCEAQARNPPCSHHEGDNGPFWSPQPVGFLVCFAEDEQCPATIVAPIYDLVEVGVITGVGGGNVSSGQQERPYERQITSRATYPRPVY